MHLIKVKSLFRESDRHVNTILHMDKCVDSNGDRKINGNNSTIKGKLFEQICLKDISVFCENVNKLYAYMKCVVYDVNNPNDYREIEN